MIAKKLIFIVFIMILISCNRKKEIELIHHFPGQSWNRFDKINLSFQVEDIKPSYDIFLKINHTDKYPYKNLRFNLIIYMPSGEERIVEYDFDMRKEDGGFSSAVINDHLEVIFPLRSELRFMKTGICRFEFEDLIPRLEIPGIIKMSVILKKNR
ncbi:MAG: hypothetical protein KAT48_12465 [Bacteroidales bacterium]|nr:hypothetical protein [Bacteroidales bacterium]